MKSHLMTFSTGTLALLFLSGFAYSNYGPTSLNYCAEVMQQEMSRTQLQSKNGMQLLTRHDTEWQVCEPIIKSVVAKRLPAAKGSAS